MRLLLLFLLGATTGIQNPGGLRQKIKDALFVPNPLPALNAKVHSQIELELGIVADKVTYATEYGMRVPAVVYHPRSTSIKRPALIVVNGHGAISTLGTHSTQACSSREPEASYSHTILPAKASATVHGNPAAANTTSIRRPMRWASGWAVS